MSSFCRFHPDKELVLTSSGDGTAHIWQCAVHISNESFSGRVASSEDELADGESSYFAVSDSFVADNNEYGCSVLRTPLRSLAGHLGVVIAADWLPGGDQVVTAGWDRLACVWDTQTGQLLHQLTGHDDELTHASVHPSARLVVTSSKDSTFRLWDFR
jgi:WD40 repeat protein